MSFSLSFLFVFTEISRFNHSCSSNANVTWNEDEKSKVVQSVSDIKIGDEITVNYDWQETSMKKLETRQDYLSKNWGFKCCCDLCQVLIIRLFVYYSNYFLKNPNYYYLSFTFVERRT